MPLFKSSVVNNNKPCLRSFGSESSPNCCCFVGHTWVTSPRNGPGWRCLFCWGSDYALYRFVLTLHFLPAAVFYALATRFSNTARLFYSCPLFGQDQTKADRILRNCFEGGNMAPRSNQTSIVACNTCPYHGWNWCELKGPDTSICSIAKSVQSSSLPIVLVSKCQGHVGRMQSIDFLRKDQ